MGNWKSDEQKFAEKYRRMKLYNGNILDTKATRRAVEPAKIIAQEGITGATKPGYKRATKYLKFCYTCNTKFTTLRVDKLTCCTNCAKKLQNVLMHELPPTISPKLGNMDAEKYRIKFGFKKRKKVEE